MNWPNLGSLALFVSLVACLASIVALGLGARKPTARKSGGTPSRKPARTPGQQPADDSLGFAGRVATVITAVGLSLGVGLLIYCFLGGDNSIYYVVQYRSGSSSGLAWLYQVSGLWGGRSGSLLFWAWLLSMHNLTLALRRGTRPDRLDQIALSVSQLVLLAFIAVLTFSQPNMPFTPTPAEFLDANGQLTGQALLMGMNPLLEHWAMAIHPPTLFIGYAGLTIPFAYAIAALITNDASRRWVDRCQRYALVSWLFLGLGIGLGAVWAYVVLGWGGYWGWDPVENASLLSWLIAVALIHSFTVYRQRGAFKRWSIMTACLAFCFVIVGTFITRSGIVQSVHAFESDPVSLALFGTLIAASALSGGLGLLWRGQAFRVDAADETEQMLTRDTAYYFNNVVMLIVTVLVTYLTLAPALPGFLPFGGQSLSAVTYNAIARPLGILYCLVMAVCPLLAWQRADLQAFWRRIRLPAIAAAGLFLALMVYFVIYLVPAYMGIKSGGGSAATALADSGPAWYYLGLTVLGLATASLLLMDSLILLGRLVRIRAKSRDIGLFQALWQSLRSQASLAGGFLAHLGIAVVLVGLIGSSMYVTEAVGDIGYEAPGDEFVIKDYTLRFADYYKQESDDGETVYYILVMDVEKGGRAIGQVSPSLQIVQATQRKLDAATLTLPGEDLFVVFNGVSMQGGFSLDVRVNPLINLVWAGFGLLMAGTLVAAAGHRRTGGSGGSGKLADEVEDAVEPGGPDGSTDA